MPSFGQWTVVLFGDKELKYVQMPFKCSTIHGSVAITIFAPWVTFAFQKILNHGQVTLC